MANLNISAVLQVLDRATAPLRQIAGGSSHAAAALKAAREQVKALQRQQGDIHSFKQLSQGLSDTHANWWQHAIKLIGCVLRYKLRLTHLPRCYVSLIRQQKPLNG